MLEGKYLCVKSYKAGIFLTKGEIYEFKMA